MTTEEREERKEFTKRPIGFTWVEGVVLVFIVVSVTLLVCWAFMWTNSAKKAEHVATMSATASLGDKAKQVMDSVDGTKKVIEELQRMAMEKDKEIADLKAEAASLKWRADFANENYLRFKEKIEAEERAKKP